MFLEHKCTDSLGAGKSICHTYGASSNGVLHLGKVSVSSSAECKMEIIIGGEIKVVKFATFPSPNVEYVFERGYKLSPGEKVSVVITNRYIQSQNVYSTVEGLVE